MRKIYRYEFPIGDWSGDGHEKCEYFIVEGNKPLEDVREAHFKAPKVLGLEIGSLCSEFEQGWIPHTIIQKLKGQGVEIPEMEQAGPDEPESDFDPTPTELLQLWINILNHIDPELNLRAPPEEERVPSIVFTAFDKKRRHLRAPGYGLF
jgi:hypothetical protein